MKDGVGLHDGLPQLLSLDTIARGAVIELGDEALKRVAANIADVNTEATQKRRITVTIDVTPYKDRTGAELSVKVDTKLAGMRPADGTMYIARKNGEYLAFGRDTRQTEIAYDMTADAAVATAKPQ